MGALPLIESIKSPGAASTSLPSVALEVFPAVVASGLVLLDLESIVSDVLLDFESVSSVRSLPSFDALLVAVVTDVDVVVSPASDTVGLYMGVELGRYVGYQDEGKYVGELV